MTSVRERRRRQRDGTPGSGRAGTSAASFVRKPLASKRVIGPIPLRPATRPAQVEARSFPRELTAPRPVMTTVLSDMPGIVHGVAAAQQDDAPARIIGRMTERVDWNRYFMNIAAEVATRSTCPRKHVGAVIVRDRRILSTGYNGSLRGLPHCDEAGCLMEDGHCIATVHAEANAILQAAMNGVRIEGGEIYTTASPCWNCFKLIGNAGLVGIYFSEFYREPRILDYAERMGIRLVDLGPGRR
jgi:dCMP deaminase